MASYLGILDQLNKIKNFKYCDKFRLNLIANLKKRLGWIESKDLYVHATTLTPKYGLN